MRGVSKADLEGPKIDRRTAVKLLAAAGVGGMAGCVGDDSDDDDGDDSASPSDDDDTNGDDADDTPRMGGSVEAGLLRDGIDNADPALVDLRPSWSILWNVFNSIVRVNQDGEFVGELAEDWTLPDNSTYEFTLHEGVTFHNGDPLDAEAAKWHIERIMDLEESPAHGQADPIESVEAPDETTLRISLEEPFSPFIVNLTAPHGGLGTITNRTAVEEDPDHYNEFPIGSGPFEFADHSTGEYLLFEKFDDYWETDDEGNSLPYLDEVRVNFIPEASTMWTALSNRDIDMAYQISGDQVDQAEANEDLVVQTPFSGTYRVLHMLSNDPASDEWRDLQEYVSGRDPTDMWEDKELVTANENVRRAIKMAINREEVIEQVWFGIGEPAHTVLHPGHGIFYEAEPEYGHYYDPERAEEILDEEGYTGDPRFSVRLLGWNAAWSERMSTVLQQQLGQIGIDVEIDIRSSSETFDVLVDFEHELFMYGGAGNLTPHGVWWDQALTPTEDGSQGGRNRALWRNEEFDEAVKEYVSKADPEDALPYVKEAEQIFMEEGPYASIANPNEVRAHYDSLKGMNYDMGNVWFTRAYLDE